MNAPRGSLPLGFVAVLLMLSPACGAGIGQSITFEDQPFGNIAGNSLTIVAGGVPVTFSGVGLQVRPLGDVFPSGRMLSTRIDSEVITVTFGGLSVLFAEFENHINGRYTSEVDVITGTAFNAAGSIVDSAMNSDTIFRLEGPGITRIVYDDDNQGGGYLIDNFHFLVVPEPASSTMAFTCAVSCILLRVRCRFARCRQPVAQ
jgi:hypothetical protein